MWGRTGMVVGIDAPPQPGGGPSHRQHQVYAVMFDGDNAPMDIYEGWLESA